MMNNFVREQACARNCQFTPSPLGRGACCVYKQSFHAYRRLWMRRLDVPAMPNLSTPCGYLPYLPCLILPDRAHPFLACHAMPRETRPRSY